MQFKNIIGKNKWLEIFEEMLPHIGNEKIPLPNMNIIKKIKDFCFNYLESFVFFCFFFNFNSLKFICLDKIANLR